MLCNDDKCSLIDAGIIMYYFENMVKSIGINGEWTLINQDNIKVNGNVYKTMGEFKL